MESAVPYLYFVANSHVLLPHERRKLAQIASALKDILRDFPDLIIAIEGYSDDWYRPEYNDKLARERTEAVRRVLFELSSPEDCLRVEGFGYHASQFTTQDECCGQKNRRGCFRAAVAILDARTEKP